VKNSNSPNELGEARGLLIVQTTPETKRLRFFAKQFFRGLDALKVRKEEQPDELFATKTQSAFPRL